MIGPLCKDRNIIGGRSRSQPGGVTWYAGQALACLEVDTVVFGSFGQERPGWLRGFKAELVHLAAEKTIEFVNEYPENNPSARIQRAGIYSNKIRIENLEYCRLAGLDYIVLGPLYNDNISVELVEKLSKCARLVLSAQGAIRYLDGDRIVWKNPDNVLRVLPYVDYIFLDDKELRFISQREDLQEAARFLQENGAGNVMVTQGEQGSWIFLEDKEYKIRAFPPLELVDPTGAGDSYLAGFIKALELFDEPLQQGEFAAMTATLSIEHRGPFNKTTDEVCQRLGWR
ncbi:MAG TPA: PfkB family carbohydrate kinase [archaeon]|nr:PfkB family carbohydrate kinase [archaeon]